MVKYSFSFLVFTWFILVQPLLANVSNFSIGSNTCFIENKGQVRDQNDKPRPDVLFAAKTKDLTFHLHQKGISYQLNRVESWKEEVKFLPPTDEAPKKIPNEIGIYRVDVNWVNHNKKFEAVTEYPLAGYSNYYNVPEGIEPALYVKSYGSVLLKNVWNGVDVHYYFTDGNLECDFLVTRAEDYKNIAFEIKGAELSVSKEDELVMQTPFGEIREGRLKVFQDGKQVKAKWQLKGNTVRFSVPEYNKEKPLRIDPVVRVWATYVGGVINDQTDWDYNHTCKVDPNGNILVEGNAKASSTTNVASTGAHQTTKPFGVYTPTLLKFDPNGQRIWGTYYGGNFEEYAYTCTVDNASNVYMSGITTSPTGIATPGSYQPNMNPGSSCFIVKFNSAGVRQWGTYFGGNNGEAIWGSCIDNQSNLLICGYTNSTTDIATPGTHKTTLSTGAKNANDAFLVKFSPAGARLQGTYFGSANPSTTGNDFREYAGGVAVDANNNIYLTGYTNSTDGLATAGAQQTVYGGGTYDFFLAKFNNSMQLQWATYHGGAGNETNYEADFDLAVDNTGSAVIAGRTYSTTGIATTGAHQTTYSGSSDAFLAKYNTNGVLEWGTYYGGTGSEAIHATAIDVANNIYVAGMSNSPTGISTPDGFQTTLANTLSDQIVAKFSPTGTLIWGTYYGGTGADEFAIGAAVDNNSGAIYVCGTTNSKTNFSTAGVHQSTYGGGYGDGTLVKFIDCPNAGNAAPTSNSPLCVGQTLNLSVSGPAGATYQWTGPNNFTSTQQNPTVTNAQLAASGTYNVTVTANGCPGATGSVTVNITSPVSATASSNTPVCPGQTINLTSGTVTGATYAWSGPGGFASAQQNPAIVNATSAMSGTYTVTVTANGCSATATTNVSVTALQTLTASSNSPVCVGQTLNLTANNLQVQSYAWSGPNGFTSAQQNPNIPNVATAQAGTYTVSYLDFNGCTSSAIVQVTVANPPVATATSNSPVCAGQPLNLSVNTTNGAAYTWSGPNGFTSAQQNPSIISPSTAASGNYNVTVTVGSCTANGSVSVTVNPSPTATATANSPVCAGQDINLGVNATAGATYAWSGPNNFTSSQQNAVVTAATTNATGVYTVTVTANGCNSTSTVNVTVNTPPTATVSSNSPICEGQALNLAVNSSANATYTWAGPNGYSSTQQNPSIANTTTANAGSYTVTVAVPGCNNATSNVSVTINPSPTVNATSNSPVCEGGDINLSVNTTTNATYQWSGVNGFSSTQQNPVLTAVGTNAAGGYTVTVTANGCSRTGNVNVVVNPLPMVAASYNNPLCEGSDLNLTATTVANATYAWSGVNGFTSTQQNPTIANVQTAQAGSYTVTVTDAQGCSASGSVNVNVNAATALNITATSTPATICAGQSATLTATGASIYEWSANLGAGATHTVTPTTNTAYTVTATDATTGCTATANTSVIVNPIPTATITATQTTLCQSGNVTLFALGGSTYQWSSGETTSDITVSPTSTTTYTVTATDANGCTNTASQAINVLSFTTPQFAIANNITLCYGNAAPVLPTISQNGITGSWQPAVISNTQDGVYTFTPDAGQCAADYIVNVTVQQISLLAGPDTLVELATNMQLYTNVSGSANGIYQWEPATNLSCNDCAAPKLFALSSTIYTVTYTDAQTGCKASTDVNVEVNYDPNTVYYIPNMFSPNGDGSNDFFEIYGKKIKEIEVQIFNKWGEMVFNERSVSPKWDGYYRGELSPAGVYVYNLYVVFYNGSVVKNKGSLTLVR